MPHHTELPWSCRAGLHFSCCSSHLLPCVPPLSSSLLHLTWILELWYGTVFVWRFCHLLAKLVGAWAFPLKPVIVFALLCPSWQLSAPELTSCSLLLLGRAHPLQDLHRTLGGLPDQLPTDLPARSQLSHLHKLVPSLCTLVRTHPGVHSLDMDTGSSPKYPFMLLNPREVVPQLSQSRKGKLRSHSSGTTYSLPCSPSQQHSTPPRCPPFPA